MASLGGIGASFTGTNLSGGTAPPGRDFIDLQSKILTSGSLETFDVGMSGAQPVGETLQLKIWRINGANYDFIGESQKFSNLAGGVNTGLTLTTPINVLVGDLISISLSDSASNIVETGSVIGAGIDFKAGDDSTSQPISGYTNLADISLAVEVFGTAGGGGGGDSITITSIADHTCSKRDVNGQATFTVAGDIIGTTASVMYQLDGGEKILLDGSPTSTFSGSVTVTNQQDITVSFSDNVAITDTVIKISATVNLAAAPEQSNGAGRLTNNQNYTVGAGKPTPIMYKSGSFSEMTDPTGVDGSAAGSIWPLIAQYYIDAGIPVCVANVAQGATLLSQWQVGGAYYNRIVSFAEDAGGLSLAIAIIGEQDSFAETPQSTIEAEMGAIVDALFAAYGIDTYIANHPEGDGGAWDDTVTKAAYANVIANNIHARFGGDLSVIDIDIATTAGNDGIHLKSDADAQSAADIIYTAITSVTSSLLITDSNAPDGTYSGNVWDDVAGVKVGVYDFIFSGGNCALTLPVATGTKYNYLIEGNNPPVTGIADIGVTV